MTILFLGLCISYVSGFFTVICHGSDGHIAVEALVHNHCECPRNVQISEEDNFAETLIDSSSDHDHCRDTLATSYLAVPAQKKIKRSTHKVLTANLFQKSIANYATCFSGYLTAQSYKSASFFAPLRTVIFLA
jgi:hypothetical protein